MENTSTMKSPMMATKDEKEPVPATYAYTYQDVEGGFGQGPTSPDAFNPSAGSYGFSTEAAIRKGFIRKVYGVLSLQLALTCAICSVFTFVDPVRVYVLSNMWPFYTSMVLGFVCLFAMMCYQDRHPVNIILLGVWTALESVIIGTTVAAYASAGAGGAVVNALFLTMAIFTGLTIFTFQSRIDFTFLGAGLFGMLWILIVWGLVIAIFGWQTSFWYSLLGAIVFSLYILFDTSMIMRRLPPDAWVHACLSLYLDIINLFLFLLQLFASRRD